MKGFEYIKTPDIVLAHDENVSNALSVNEINMETIIEPSTNKQSHQELQRNIFFCEYGINFTGIIYVIS